MAKTEDSSLDSILKSIREAIIDKEQRKHFEKKLHEEKKERLEKEMMEEQKKLLKAKTESLESAAEIKELYENALNAMREYSGHGRDDQ